MQIKMKRITIPYFILFFLISENIFCQSTDGTIPVIISMDGRHALLVDGKPYLILAGQAHNSSGWPALLPGVWSSIEEMHANTLEVPLYWEQIEPQPGKFDFSLIDTLLNQSRQHQKHLVLLWFATWKNGSNHYMPEWMKRDAMKYPNITGKDGKPVDSPSPNATATLDADTKAFVEVMKYLKKSDQQHTVIMVQIENEAGSWGSVRDYSQAAEKLFNGKVPQELIKPNVLTALHVPLLSGSTWQQVFGERADEYFQAWSIARFIGQLAKAGKAEYALPMYVNAALRDPLTNPFATNYESGGPTDNVIPIWKVAAPAIDLVAPDIYLPETEKVMKVIELYDRPDNALFVPEAATSADKVKYMYDVIARGGIGFSPFGIDYNGNKNETEKIAKRLEPFAEEYAIIAPMMRELATWAFEGKIIAVIERDDHAEQKINLGKWEAVISFGITERNKIQTNAQPVGKMMIVKMDDDKFLVIGSHCHITFLPAGVNAAKAWQYLKVEEGAYDNGEFKPARILNGDETDWGGPRIGITPLVLRISLVTR
jgi:uncharacterized protein DUF5597/glycosyl hydrolase family 42 (putative beta-galactosidase)